MGLDYNDLNFTQPGINRVLETTFAKTKDNNWTFTIYHININPPSDSITLNVKDFI